MAQSTGVQPPELRTPPCPVSLRPLMHAFTEMASARSSGFGAPQAMSWEAIGWWASLTQTPVTPFEVRVLRLLDAAWIKAWADAQPAPDTKRKARG